MFKLCSFFSDLDDLAAGKDYDEDIDAISLLKMKNEIELMDLRSFFYESSSTNTIFIYIVLLNTFTCFCT